MVTTSAPALPTAPGLAAPRLAAPELAALGAPALVDAFAAVFADASVVSRPRVDYLDLVPGRRLVVQATAEVDGVEETVVARPGGVVHRLRDDPALPLLRSGARVLAYVPGRRATLAVPPYVVKTYAQGAEFTAAAAALRLLGDGVDLPVPAPVAVLTLHRATLQRHVEGTATDVHGALAAADEAAALLVRLHSSRRTGAVRRGCAAELEAAARAVRVLLAVLPEQGARAQRLLHRLARTAPTGLPTVLSHGDFTVDQLLRTPTGGLVVTDVDTACHAPAALDVSTFAANLVSGRPGDADRSAAVLDRVLAVHDRPPGLHWYLAVALLRRCDRPFRRLKKRWPEKSASILDAAQKVSSRCA